MIKPYFETEPGKLYHGDCSGIMSGIQSDSIDLLLTDPPYGYSFMGKDWDKAVIHTKVWKECLRILKPGAFAFIMSAPRQDVLSRMIINLQDAGFYTEFTSIYWTYASGFPKAGNVSKLVDKRLGAVRIKGEPKPYTSDKSIQGNNYGGGDYERIQEYYTISATDQAKQLDGSYMGFQPKPAVEIIIVVMKPLSEKTYVEQAMKNGKGITWLDDCRIPYIKNQEDTRRKKGGWQLDQYVGGKEYKNYPIKNQDDRLKGRFPANLLVSDDVLNDGNMAFTKPHRCKKKHSEGGMSGKFNASEGEALTNINDSGSFSRYFDLDKWWEKKLKELSPSARKTFPFLIIPKASKGEKNEGCDELEKKEKEYGKGFNTNDYRPDGSERKIIKAQNNHPTVKPLKLFSYLITLGSRANDLIIDPFIGSGTMAVACENMNRTWIGIDLSEEYCKIAVERIKKETVQFKLELTY